MEVANPIYDVVFKYLLEDVRVARIILSALLKEDVLSVEPRAHEYTGKRRRDLSMYRVDFAARVRQPDGKEQQVLIEIQKSWVPSETLRFRQYLGVQYEDKRNIDDKGYGLPMVAVYILGHKVGDIEEPVLYVKHEAQDYDGNVVTHGLPDPFVSSLTHDSIIVQVPRLHGKINNRLDKILSVFNQTQANEENQHTLLLDESRYDEDDHDMQLILRRLLEAAASSDMRYEMNVEDEYFSQLEKNETDLLRKDKEIAEQRVLLAEKNAELSAQKSQLDQKDAELSVQKDQLDQKDAELSAQKDQLDQKDAELSAQKDQLDQKNAELSAQKDQLDQKNAELNVQKSRLAEKNSQLKKMIVLLQESGLSLDAIAKSLGEDIETVRSLTV